MRRNRKQRYTSIRLELLLIVEKSTQKLAEAFTQATIYFPCALSEFVGLSQIDVFTQDFVEYIPCTVLSFRFNTSITVRRKHMTNFHN